MEDPCKTCYDVDKRNSFIRDYYTQLPEILKDSKGQYLFKQNKEVPRLTRQKEMERQILETERRYRELYNNSPIALYRTRTSDGKLLEGNQALAELFGYDSIEEFQADTSSTSRYVNKNARTLLLNKLKKHKHVKSFDIQVERKGGEIIWVEVTAEIFPEKGFIEGTLQDITACKLLSKAERVVLRFIVEGKSNKEIAITLNRSTRTIEDHRSHIMQKLGANNIAELIQKAASLRPEMSEQ